jgi:lysophospholipase L1-like esterase
MGGARREFASELTWLGGVPRLGIRRLLALAGLVALSTVLFAWLPFPGAEGHATAREFRWVATWTESPQPASFNDPLALRGFDDETIRELVFPSVGGSSVRVQFTNRFGTRPLRLLAAAIASDPAGSPNTPGPGFPLRFDGGPSVTIAPGATVTSEAAPLRVNALRDLLVSLYLAAPTGPATGHAVAGEVNYVERGDDVLAAHLSRALLRTTSSFFVDRVSVLASSNVRGAVVALGDSITDGFHAAIDANASWPDDLARRFDRRAGPKLAVLDAGISGNRVLHGSPCFGASALARFDSDALAQPALEDVIVLEGTNDIGMSRDSSGCSAPHTPVSAAEIIAGYRQLIAEARRAHVAIFGGTLIPFGGSRFWTPAAELTRQTVNRWILTSGAFDGVIDFARAVADPRDPQILDPRYDSGDHLHPNDAGYRAMARAVSLAMLMRG